MERPRIRRRTTATAVRIAVHRNSTNRMMSASDIAHPPSCSLYHVVIYTGPHASPDGPLAAGAPGRPIGRRLSDARRPALPDPALPPRARTGRARRGGGATALPRPAPDQGTGGP